jgi:hypothetical protein
VLWSLTLRLALIGCKRLDWGVFLRIRIIVEGVLIRELAVFSWLILRCCPLLRRRLRDRSLAH